MHKLLLWLGCTILLLACQPSGQAPLPAAATSSREDTATAATRATRIIINDPKEAATLLDNQTLFLDYEIIAPPAPLRAKLILDGKELAQLDAAKSSYPLGKLKVGAHLLKLELLGADGKSTGINTSRILTVVAAPE